MVQQFDYKGYSVEKIEAMCEDTYGERTQAKDKYWVTTAYSMGKFIREYADIPPNVPLPCYSVHAVHRHPVADPHELDNDAAFFLCCNSIKYDAFRKASTKPCYIVPTPLPWLRRAHNMKKSPSAKGTIAYFQHSAPDFYLMGDMREIVNNYINELLFLPKMMHPICVCLHMHDVHTGVHNLFLERGIPVYTAGNVFNTMFYKEFYDILLNFSYATATTMGSHAYYAVDAGIPFFLHGEEKAFFNAGDSNLPLGKYSDQSLLKKSLHSLFGMLAQEITPQQSKTVNFFLGKDCKYISPADLKEKISVSLIGR